MLCIYIYMYTDIHSYQPDAHTRTLACMRVRAVCKKKWSTDRRNETLFNWNSRETCTTLCKLFKRNVFNKFESIWVYSYAIMPLWVCDCVFGATYVRTICRHARQRPVWRCQSIYACIRTSVYVRQWDRFYWSSFVFADHFERIIIYVSYCWPLHSTQYTHLKINTNTKNVNAKLNANTSKINNSHITNWISLTHTHTHSNA